MEEILVHYQALRVSVGILPQAMSVCVSVCVCVCDSVVVCLS
jgi:hypothetical protein